MLTVRDAQLDALQLQRDESVLRELVDHLHRRLPESCARLGGRRELRGFVEQGLPRALALGVRSVATLAALFELWLQFGGELERSPLRAWSLTILAHPIMAGELKVETIWARHDSYTEGRRVVPA